MQRRVTSEVGNLSPRRVNTGSSQESHDRVPQIVRSSEDVGASILKACVIRRHKLLGMVGPGIAKR